MPCSPITQRDVVACPSPSPPSIHPLPRNPFQDTEYAYSQSFACLPVTCIKKIVDEPSRQNNTEHSRPPSPPLLPNSAPEYLYISGIQSSHTPHCAPSLKTVQISHARRKVPKSNSNNTFINADMCIFSTLKSQLPCLGHHLVVASSRHLPYHAVSSSFQHSPYFPKPFVSPSYCVVLVTSM